MLATRRRLQHIQHIQHFKQCRHYLFVTSTSRFPSLHDGRGQRYNSTLTTTARSSMPESGRDVITQRRGLLRSFSTTLEHRLSPPVLRSQPSLPSAGSAGSSDACHHLTHSCHRAGVVLQHLPRKNRSLPQLQRPCACDLAQRLLTITCTMCRVKLRSRNTYSWNMSVPGSALAAATASRVHVPIVDTPCIEILTT